MTEVALAALARNDLVEIGLFTERRWGAEQRLRYLSLFESAVATLASGSKPGTRRHGFGPGIRSFPVGRHVLFYREEAPGRIVVLRILHQSMDPARRF